MDPPPGDPPLVWGEKKKEKRKKKKKKKAIKWTNDEKGAMITKFQSLKVCNSDKTLERPTETSEMTIFMSLMSNIVTKM